MDARAPTRIGERNACLCRLRLPQRCCRCRIERRRVSPLELPQVPSRVHQGQIGERDVAADAFDFLGVPERKRVVVAGGNQDAVRLHRLQHVMGEVPGKRLMGPAGGNSIAEEGYQRECQDRTGRCPSARTGATIAQKFHDPYS